MDETKTTRNIRLNFSLDLPIYSSGCNFCPFGVQKKCESESECESNRVHSRSIFLKTHTDIVFNQNVGPYLCYEKKTSALNFVFHFQ